MIFCYPDQAVPLALSCELSLPKERQRARQILSSADHTPSSPEKCCKMVRSYFAFPLFPSAIKSSIPALHLPLDT